MEAVEEVAPPSSPPKDLSPAAIAKGKRTKRLRSPYSPIRFTVTQPPIAAVGDFPAGYFNHHPASSEESTTTEEVDTARCLLLLSRGGHCNSPNTAPGAAAFKAAAGGGEYTCKTCNRAFPSFQALGGHRASHRKPKNLPKSAIFSDEEDYPSPPSSKNRISPHSLTLQLSNVSTTSFSAATPKSSSPPRPRVHECSYCGAEFTSGQALGGHMRKHRGGGGLIGRSVSIPVESLNITTEPSIEELELRRSKKARTEVLSLDLNLPAPEDEKSMQDKKEAAAELGLSIAANPPLVDCHY